MRVELVTPCSHGQEEEHYLCDEPPYICLPDKSCECPGGSRSTVSGFSPEAVQAAARAAWDDNDPQPGMGWDLIPEGQRKRATRMAAAALAAAWATDFGLPDKETTDE